MLPIRRRLDHQRWHFQHGPIDLVIGADGDAQAVAAAHEAAWSRFQTVLTELVAELPQLRQPVGDGACALQGVVARRMWSACRPLCGSFITPMAAVAGAVAEEIIASYRSSGVQRAWVNNGGDIALHLAAGRSLRVGVFGHLARVPVQGHRVAREDLRLDGGFEVHAAMPVRGVATSGWRGRSFSLGIADSVTVLARTAAAADAAATVVANAVDVDDPRIVRQPARSLRDDSDLGDIDVTVDVPPLRREQVQRALAAGLQRARELHACGLIEQALLLCQGQVASTDHEGETASRLVNARRASFARGSVLA